MELNVNLQNWPFLLWHNGGIINPVLTALVYMGFFLHVPQELQTRQVVWL